MDEQTKVLYREILERFNKIIWTHRFIYVKLTYTYLKRKSKIKPFRCFLYWCQLLQLPIYSNGYRTLLLLH